MSKIQLYINSFLEPCLNLFRSNVPNFFDPSEEELLRKYLIKVDINYYLYFNREENLVASGGYEYDNTLQGIVLTWGMVHSKFQSNRYGTYLTNYRLEKIKKEYPKMKVFLNTSQKTYQFYQKFGFELIKVTKDGYGEGLDRYDMIKNKKNR